MSRIRPFVSTAAALKLKTITVWDTRAVLWSENMSRDNKRMSHIFVPRRCSVYMSTQPQYPETFKAFSLRKLTTPVLQEKKTKKKKQESEEYLDLDEVQQDVTERMKEPSVRSLAAQ